MKKSIPTLICASLASLALCAEHETVRDPFWPVGYAPPPPPGIEQPIEPPKPVIQAPEPPKPPPPPPVTDDEWKMARKLLKVNGYAVAQKQDGAETTKTSLVIINLKHYNTGDKIKLTHNRIDFVWTVGTIGNNSVELLQDSAVRTDPLKEGSVKSESLRKPVGNIGDERL